MIHELKQLPGYFEDVISGKKTFEVRKNDRLFQIGDMLALNEYNPVTKTYTGNSCLVYVDYILYNEDFCKEGYVIIAIKPVQTRLTSTPYRPEAMACDYRVPYATRKETT